MAKSLKPAPYIKIWHACFFATAPRLGAWHTHTQPFRNSSPRNVLTCLDAHGYAEGMSERLRARRILLACHRELRVSVVPRLPFRTSAGRHLPRHQRHAASIQSIQASRQALRGLQIAFRVDQSGWDNTYTGSGGRI
eukprot:1478558-Prymnesium_polylepis.1